MLTLSIETSCDETSAAVVKGGGEVLSNVISSQVEFHRKYGGIVPELASRKHIEVINSVIQEALNQAKVQFRGLDAVAVTYGPGLVGSLLVGVCAAKALAYALDIPLIGINHLEGHIYANFLNSPPLSPSLNKRGGNPSPSLSRTREGVSFPFVCLLVSGGHTSLVLVKGHGKYKVLGQTRDDAAGEAFDKVARFLGLGYPGGPIIDKIAKQGDPKAIKFTRPMLDGYDFSFSGIKTAVVNLVTRDARRATRDIAASFQQAIVDVLVDKTIRAAREFKCETIALAGGVAANSLLRKELSEKGEKVGLSVHVPPLEYCTDNAAMIGCAAFYKLKTRDSRLVTRDLDLSPVASLRL